MTNRVSVRRLAAEFLVIVIGVLAAFAVDAWWGRRQENAEADRLVAAVVDELHVNLRRLERAIEAHGSVAEAGFALLNLTGPQATAEAQAQALQLIPQYYADPRTSLDQIALSAALEAGILPTIGDDEARRLLPILPVAYADLARWEERIQRLAEEEFFPRLWLYVPQLNVEIEGAFGGEGPLWEDFATSVPSRSRFEPNAEALLGDIVFENIVVERTTLLQVGEDRASRIESMVQTVLDGLEGGS